MKKKLRPTHHLEAPGMKKYNARSVPAFTRLDSEVCIQIDIVEAVSLVSWCGYVIIFERNSYETKAFSAGTVLSW